jgi:hypothetical protein
MTYSGTFDDLIWQETTAPQDTFKVAADSCPAVGSVCHRSHTFFVRAVDNDGARDLSPAYVGFDATTFTPRSQITDPIGSGVLTLPTCVKIKWGGTDSDGEPVMFRYALKKYSGDPQSEKFPPEGDSHLSEWDTSKQLTIRMLANDPDDPDDIWSFYVQAKDNAGAIEGVFQDGRNHIYFVVDSTLDSQPYVRVCCVQGACDDVGMPSFDCRSSDNPGQMDIAIDVPVGTEICFKATAFPGLYAKSVTHIAYLVNDPEEPGGWYDYTKPENRCYPSGSQGIIVSPNENQYCVWVRDDYCEYGTTARVYIIINGVSP